jgi:sortase A
LAKLLRLAAIVLGVAGVLALADGVLTLVWQEPISGLLAHFDQARLAKDLKRLESARATPAEERALAALPSDNARMAYFARELQRTARAGQPVARIRIPRIGADFVVVAGTDEASLKKGPGVYAGTSLPGLPGTVGIAGHRTTYLAPFRRINELAKGDRITLEMPYGLFSYTVLGHRIVSPNDVSVLARTPYDQVVLTACNPLYSAAQRIVVFARLTAAAPAGEALSPVGVGVVAAPSPIPAAVAAAAVIGDLGPDLTGPGAPPREIDPGAVVFGDGAAAQPLPARRAPRRVAATPRASAKPKLPAPVRRPVTSPAPVVRSPAPVSVAPRTPAPVVHAPVSSPVHTPPTSSPAHKPTATAPSNAAPPPVQHQTRVQGAPSGPTPIIGVPSG